MFILYTSKQRMTDHLKDLKWQRLHFKSPMNSLTNGGLKTCSDIRCLFFFSSAASPNTDNLFLKLLHTLPYNRVRLLNWIPFPVEQIAVFVSSAE